MASAGVALAALVLVAATSHRWGRAGACALVAVSVWWLLVNDPMEGETLFIVTRGHGLTAADLAGLTGLAVAAWRLVRRGAR